MRSIDLLLQKSPERIIYNPISKNWHPFRINFVTLTISDKRNIDAREAYEKLLKPYLRKLRQYGQISYVWKAELQKRGQLHYHITTNCFIPWQSIRTDWNKIQRRAGFLETYGYRFGHYDANSTDIHSVKHVRDLSAYMAKYITKENSKKLNGKVWDCSTDLKKPFFTITPNSTINEKLHNPKRFGISKTIELEHCTIFKYKDIQQILSPAQIAIYKNYL